MFKLTKGGYGLRRSSGGGGQVPRVSGLTALRVGISVPHPIRPAFLPETVQEQTFDSNTPRVDETA